MGVISDAFDRVWRDYVTDNVPGTGAHEPVKKEIREIGALIEQAFSASLGNVDVSYATLAELDADLAWGEGSTALVYSDPAADNIDLYTKSGASGAGAWANTNALHDILEALAKPYADAAAASAAEIEQTFAQFSAEAADGTAVVGGFLGADDEAVFQVRADGKIENVHIEEIESRAADFGPEAVVGGFLGADDEAVFQVRADGKIENVHIEEIESRLDRGDVPRAQNLGVATDFFHIAIYGQSLSIGALGSPPRSTDPLPWAKMFVGGVISEDGTDPGRYASLTDLVEQTEETIASGMVLMLAQLLQDEDGFDLPASGLTPFLSSSGSGGRSANDLSKGGVEFSRFETDVSQADALDAGKSYQMLAMPFLQGEQDYTEGTNADAWARAVEQIRQDAQAHAQAVSGVDRPLPMLVYQLSQHVAKSRRPSLALAALDLCENENIGFATPLYFIPAVDTAHRDANGYFWLGSYFGLALKRWLWDGVKPEPMLPDDVVWGDDFVSLRFPTQEGGLVLDTALVDDPGDYGFRLYQSDGVTPVPIDDVALIGDDRVIVRAAMPANARLRYAWENAPGDVEPFEGPQNGARGNLRDSRGDTIIADPLGSAFPLHQFAPIFEKVRP